MLALLQAILRRASYLALLDEQPSALARLVDVLTRLAPAHYWAAMRRPLRDAIDTTTPVA